MAESVFGKTMGAEGNDSGLQSVGDQRDKHRCRVKEHIPQERAEPAHRKCANRVQQDGGGTDYDVIQIEVPTRHRHPKGAEGDIHRHKHSGHGQPAHRSASAQRFRFLHSKKPPFF